MDQDTEHPAADTPAAAWNTSGDLARAALAGMVDAACQFDDTGIVAFNDAFLRFHRFARRTDCLRTLAAFHDRFELRQRADGAPLPVADWPASRALRGESASSVEYHLRRRDSGATWVGSYSFAPVLDAARRVSGAIITARDVSTQYQARRALELERLRLKLVLDSTGAAIWEIDLENGASITGSPDWMGRYGFAAADLPQDFAAWLALVHPDDQAQVSAAMALLQSGHESSVMIEYRLRTPTEWRWVQSRAMVSQRDTADRPQRLMGIHLDVHARHRADDALRENEQRLRTAFEANDVGMWDWQVTQDSFEYNPRLATMLGFDPPELAERAAWLALVHPDDAGRAEQALRDHLAGRQPSFAAEIRLRSKDGGWRWVQTRGQVVARDAQGRALRVTGIHLDITERKQTETALATSEARLRAVVDNIPVGIVLADPQGTPVFTNQAFRRILSLSDDESLTLGWMEFMRPADRDELSHLQQQLVTGKADEIHQEYGYQRPGHDPIDVRARIVRVTAPEADFTFLGIGEDVTLERAQEREHQRLLAHVRQAQKMEAIGQLAGGIAHDFNNLLTAVVGFSELALQRFATEESGKLAEYLGAVIAAGERGRELVAKMLTFSRQEPSGSHQTVDPLAVAREVETLLSPILPSSISLAVDTRGAVPRVSIDAVDLHQALVNLVVNARDAIDGHGAITVEVGAERPARGQCSACQAPLEQERYVTISVRDSGVGMEADTLRRIFEPFYTTKEVGRGTGMGLAVVHGVLHQAGGHVQVESAPGLGTEFRLLLRAADASVATPSENVAASGLPSSPVSGYAGLRVLVVDDEPSVLAFVTEVLEGLDMRVTRAQDGRHAFELISAEPHAFDLVFSDQTMPRMTGGELLTTLRGAGVGVPLILSSGHSDAASRRAVAEQGGIFLAKPAGPDDILAALALALGR